MSFQEIPLPWSKSVPLSRYAAMVAVDAMGYTRLPSLLHAPTSELVPALVDRALESAGLGGLRQNGYFSESSGDGIAIGFDPAHLPFVISPFLSTMEAVVGRYNQVSKGPGIRFRISVHVGPVANSADQVCGKGSARNDLHRLLDCRPLRKALMAGGAKTDVVAVLSDRAYEDAVLGGYVGLSPDEFTEVLAEVDGKEFSQRAWVYVPRLSGELLRSGLGGKPEEKSGSSPEGRPGGIPTPLELARRSFRQDVKNGIGVVGDVAGGLHYTNPWVPKRRRIDG
ncbi:MULTISPECIES: hypothetical protein [Streptomycetaceae]|uniref:hypothetical protein n=1 Tax=Streptomycetaceae TaxID=2062 RepID=UPI00093F6B32|nr:hypothetical protein [Streptomyces sp. CB02056]